MHVVAAHPHVPSAPRGASVSAPATARAVPLTDAERIALARAVERAGGQRAFAALAGVPATTVRRALAGAPLLRLVRGVLLRALPALARPPSTPSAESPPERAAGGG